MQGCVMEYVSKVVKKYGPADNLDVLEIGSRNENGSVRGIFSAAKSYVGIDMRGGDGVDVVMNSHDLKFGPASFDVVVSTETLEHDDAFWATMAEVARVLKPGGLLILTAPSNGCSEHKYPCDYWRFMPQASSALCELAGCELLDSECHNTELFFTGRRNS